MYLYIIEISLFQTIFKIEISLFGLLIGWLY